MRAPSSFFFLMVAIASTASLSNAAIIGTIQQSDKGYIRIAYSGTIDLSTVSAVGPTVDTAVSFSSQQSYFQNGPRMIYTTGSTSPARVMGNGGAVAASFVKPGSSSFHFDFINKTIGLPVGYVSGSLIEGEVFIPGSFAYHGIVQGLYEYSWAGGSESITFDVSVPEPTSMSIFAIGSVVAGIRMYRRKNKANS